jgi:hypothetical protein
MTDRILTVHDYYDGPRLGIAEWNGVPHIYEAEFDHNADEYGDTYLLSPIDPALLAFVLEDWEIWLRWQAAWKRGEVSSEPHGVLPIDAERHVVLIRTIGTRLKADPENGIRLRAAFDHKRDSVTWHVI